MTTIGTRLKNRRIEHGLNQKMLADVAGVTNAAVSKWETNGGQSMSAVVAMRLAQHLNVNPFWLICGHGEPTDSVHVPDITEASQALARKIDRLPERVRHAVQNLLTALHF